MEEGEIAPKSREEGEIGWKSKEEGDLPSCTSPLKKVCNWRLSEIYVRCVQLKITNEVKIYFLEGKISTNLHEIFQLKLKLFPFIDLIGFL